MPKPYKAKPAEYFFDMVDQKTIRIKKFEYGDNVPSSEYRLRGALMSSGHLQCDCPGASRGSGPDHKHVMWIRRLEAIFRANNWPLDNEHLTGVYFDSGQGEDGKFFKNNDLDPANLKELLEAMK